MPSTTFQWLAVTALVTSLTLAPDSLASNVKLEFELSDKFSQAQKKTVKTWLEQGLNATEHSIAPMPLSSLKFTVVKHHNNNHPVPWGQIIRGKPNAVKLHVAAKASLNDLTHDWTLYHELSHLYLPYIEHSSFWLGEGFASYMQYIIMYQAGWLDRQSFLKNIKAGFERGRAKTRTVPGRLKDVAENMWQLKAYRRVYWTGAAFFLEADIALQKRGQSLHSVMAKYVNCCLTKYSRGKTLVAKLDRVSKTDIFSRLYQEYSVRTDFPKVTERQLNQIADFYGQEAVNHKNDGNKKGSK